MPQNIESLFEELSAIDEAMKLKVSHVAETIKRQEAGLATMDDVRTAVEDAAALEEVFAARLCEVQELTGYTDDVLDEYQQLLRPSGDEGRVWRSEIEDAPIGGNLDDLVATALENLESLVPADWLREDTVTSHRLDDAFLLAPFHLVAGTRLQRDLEAPRPHRFAQMLLVSKDLLERRPDFDFWGAPTLVGEIAALGNSIDEIGACGPEAVRKLASLPYVESAEVASLIYEIVVAAAFVRRGISTEMVPARPGEKSPDLRLVDHGVPTSVECKRRLGLTQYELREAQLVEDLYASSKELLKSDTVGRCIECVFQAEVTNVEPAQFRAAIEAVLRLSENAPLELEWGTLSHRTLAAVVDVPPTLLYSPDFLQRVFGWKPLEALWDGLLAEVDRPPGILVERVRHPQCLKWASTSDAAIIKKSRGVTSLWVDAVRQIPTGEMGFVYIAYPEGARPQLADLRTRDIEEKSNSWHHRWQVRIPFSVINRLYARPQLHDALPDFIENSIRLVSPGFESIAGDYPAGIFVPEH